MKPQAPTWESLGREHGPLLARERARILRLASDPDTIRRIAARFERRWAAPRNLDHVRAYLSATLKPGRYAIYPAGLHTAALMETLRAIPGADFVVALDQTADSEASRFGLPLAKPESAASLDVDGILLSHQEFEERFHTRLREFGVRESKILPLYSGEGYRSFAPQPDLTDLPSSARTVIVHTGRLGNQVLSDRQWASLVGVEDTVKLFFGRPEFFQPSDVFRQYTCRQSLDFLGAALQRLQPQQVCVLTSFQFGDAGLAIWLRDRFPDLVIHHEIYDWAFTLPPKICFELMAFDEADLEAALDAEAMTTAASSVVVHKYGGPLWAEIGDAFRAPAVRFFPGVDHALPLTENLETLAGRPKVLYAGSLVRPSGKEHGVLELRTMELAEQVAASGCDVVVYNNHHRPGVDDEGFRTFSERYREPPVTYHPGVSFERLADEAAAFHYGLMPLDYRYDAPRLIDAVALSNRFVSYLRCGLPVIVSSSDVWTAALIREFDAGIVVDFEEIPDVATRLRAVDYRAQRDGARALLRYMAAHNTGASQAFPFVR
jgi:hypothetical protein